MWTWSFRAFRLYRTNVRIHWTLPAYLLLYFARIGIAGFSPFALLMWVALPMLLLFGSVLLHELGHVFAARRLGQATGDMILTPIGGMVMVAEGPTPRTEFWVAAGGPLVNLGLAVGAIALMLATGGIFDPALVLPLDTARLLSGLWIDGALLHFTLAQVAEINVGLFLFNVLLVAYPLDGGRMLFSWLWKRKGRRRGLGLTCQIAKILAVGMGLVALVTSMTALLIIAGLVFFQAWTTERQLAEAERFASVGEGLLVGPAERFRRSKRRAKPEGRFSRWLRQWKGRRRSARDLKELERIDAAVDADLDEAVGPLPEEVLRQLNDAVARGVASSKRSDRGK